MLGRVFGVRVRVQPLFLVLLGLAWVVGLGGEALLLLILLGTHEIAHLVVARAFGLEVVEVELWPFGGVARVTELEWADPGVEATVALAGPLNNLALLAAGLGLKDAGWLAGAHGGFFLTANLALGLFNLLPALPLDGGRALRAALAPRYGYGDATLRLVRVAPWLAGLLALGGGVSWALGRPTLGLFVYPIFLLLAAREEREMAGFHALRQLWRRGAVPAVVAVQPLAADATASLGALLRRLVPGRYHLIWVVDAHGRILGHVDEADVLEGLGALGPEASVGDLLRKV